MWKSTAEELAFLARTAWVQKPRAAHTGTLVWLHGLGDSKEGFTDLWRAEAAPGWRVVCLDAPMRPITVNMGMRMRGWYDIVSVDERSLDKDEDAAGIEESAASLEQLLRDEAKQGAPLVVGGFSQGAAMSVFTGLHRCPEALAGIVLCSGYVLQAKRLRELTAKDAAVFPPIWAYHGGSDPMVPVALARAGYAAVAEALPTLELTTKEEAALEHGLSVEEIRGVVSFVSACFAKGGEKGEEEKTK